MSIRNRLLLSFILVTLIPICIIGAVSYSKSKNALEHARMIELETIADLKVEKIETFFQERKNNIRSTQNDHIIKTNLPVILDFFTDREAPEFVVAKKMLDGQLKTIQKVYDYLDVMLVNLKGEIIYVTNDAHAEIDLGKQLPLPGNKAFIEGQNDIYLSDLFMNGRENGIPSMLITAPIHNASQTLIGLIAIEIDMAAIYSFIQDTTGLGQTGETLIAKKVEQNVLFLNPLRHDHNTALEKKVSIGSRTSLPIQNAVQSHEGSGQANDYRNAETIVVWRYIPALDWGMVVKIDTAEAFQSVFGFKIFMMIIVSFLLLVVSFISTAFARSITHPIKSLQKGMQMIRQGNLDHKITIDSGDEISSLSDNFNEMTDQINHRNKDLSDLKYDLDQASIVAITDQKGIILSVNDKFCELSKYSREELIGQDHRIINSGSHSNAYIKNMWTTIANGKVWRGHFKNRAKDGSIYWVDSTIVPFLSMAL